MLIESLTSKIYGPRSSHTQGQWGLVAIDIPKVYKYGENDPKKGTHASLEENSPLSSHLLIVTSVLKVIQSFSDRVDTVGGQTLERLQELFLDNPYKYEFYTILDGIII